MNPSVPNFYDTLFNHKKIIHTPAQQELLPAEQWDCQLGIFSDVTVVHGGEHEKLLQGIMAACKLTPDDWKVFPRGCRYQATQNLNKVRYLLLFGISEKEINITVSFPLYKAVPFHEKIWIKTHSLKDLGKEPQFKKAFWNQALKPLFGI